MREMKKQKNEQYKKNYYEETFSYIVVRETKWSKKRFEHPVAVKHINISTYTLMHQIFM